MFKLKKVINVAVFTFMSVALLSGVNNACAGGIALGSTRVIYPMNSSQVSLAITNSDSKNVFLIQSWISEQDGSKSKDFIITPPLFVIQPNKENTMRIMYLGKDKLPSDRESIFYVNSKAIPSGTTPAPGQNTLQIATQSVIKLFVRPSGLPTKSIDSPGTLRCWFSDSKLNIDNPSPYYVSIVNLNVGNVALKNTLVPPKSSAELSMKNITHGLVSFQTINDYGASSSTARQQCKMK